MKIGNITINCVFKYRFKKRKIGGQYWLFRDSHFRDWKIGLWYRSDLIVGRKDFNKPRTWSNNMVRNYMLGYDLLIICGWIEFDFGGMHLPE